MERVKKIRDYAFVHFTQREDAINAMKALNGKVSKAQHLVLPLFSLIKIRFDYACYAVISGHLCVNREEKVSESLKE